MGDRVKGELKKLAKLAYKGWQLWKKKLTEPWSQIFRDLIQVLLLNDHMKVKKWKWSRSVVSDSLWPIDCSLPGSSVHGIFQATVLQWVAIGGVFLTQGLNPGLLHCRQTLYHLNHQGPIQITTMLWTQVTFPSDPGITVPAWLAHRPSLRPSEIIQHRNYTDVRHYLGI